MKTAEIPLWELNQREEKRRMLRHLPTNQELGIELHRHITYKSGPVECDGQMEVIEVFGEKTEDANGNGLTSGKFNKTTSVQYEYAFVHLRCTDPDCQYPDVVTTNPRRRSPDQEKERKPGWRKDLDG